MVDNSLSLAWVWNVSVGKGKKAGLGGGIIECTGSKISNR